MTEKLATILRTLFIGIPIMFGFISIISIDASAQNPVSADLTWRATEVTDMQTSTTKPMACKFVTRSGSTVEWIQKEGSLTTTYTITAVSGSWSSVAQQGQLVYTIERNGKSGTLTIERNSEGLFVTTDFSQAGQFVFKLKFRIESVERD